MVKHRGKLLVPSRLGPEPDESYTDGKGQSVIFYCRELICIYDMDYGIVSDCVG